MELVNRVLSEVDPEVAEILDGEMDRQQNCLVMIPSENYASKAVLQTQGCIMTNKYAEGYPGGRFYNGCKYMDAVENLAIKRGKELFGADHVNVQPHTGTQANMAAYYALLEDGDTILAMNLSHGGHLSHGKQLNFSGKYYNAVFYSVDRETELIDLDHVRDMAKKHRPKLIVVGASAYPRILDFKDWREIADEVGAYLMADIAHIVGLVIGKVHPDPVPYCDIVTSTTHKTLRGPRGAIIMCREEYKENLDRAVFPGVQAGPLMHIIAAKAVSFKEALEPQFREYQAQIVVNAKALSKSLMKEGFRLVSGGTDNHLMLIDLTNKGLTGNVAADILEEAGIIVNKNLIPFDEASAFKCSGIRPGTPALTARGMKEPQMEIIGRMFNQVLSNTDDTHIRTQVREEVRSLCREFPVYENLDQWQ
ncbi:aminotransferase class I/II-fold pyridoxal phosphate-dependent enzyme [Candidatus Poribacteria bacterium]|nr:aminotransferase class I/II-fold pyridoxal phosphate-dependent enzyme [Candidatus Poribacteria bacterium]